MNYKLINPPNINYSPMQQILVNRGLSYEVINSWLRTTDAVINDYNLLGRDKLEDAAKAIEKCVAANKEALMIVDSDCDGFCSAALLANMLYDLHPDWTKEHLSFFMHDGKKHGMADLDIEETISKYSLILLPDAGSSDYEQHLLCAQNAVDIICLDHHEAVISSPNAIVINNQISDYPNKDFCGAGVTWQFCRFLDERYQTDYARQYIDLVALANTADMMSMLSIETKHLIVSGFRTDRLKNPLITALADKNLYLMGGKVTSEGAAWYISPFINAITRSGTAEEQQIVFNAFLSYKAYTIIPSTKRGHKPGEVEPLYQQALRVMDSVKRRQATQQKEAMQNLEGMIGRLDMLRHKALVFLVTEANIDRNIAGLAANKLAHKYCRPCCILIRDPETKTYTGSARGYNCDFKDECEKTKSIIFAQGHQGAFGLSIAEDKVDAFQANIDILLKDQTSEISHKVDMVYQDTNEINVDDIYEIGSFDEVWGKDVERPKIAIENCIIHKNAVAVYRKQTCTLKLTLGKLTLIMMNAPADLCDRLEGMSAFEVAEMSFIGHPQLNEFRGSVSPQIKIVDFELQGFKELYNYF